MAGERRNLAKQNSRTYYIENIPSLVLDGLEFTCGIYIATSELVDVVHLK